jgi:hypothetical protein
MLADGAEQDPLYADAYQKREGTRGLRLSLCDRSERLTERREAPGRKAKPTSGKHRRDRGCPSIIQLTAADIPPLRKELRTS